MTTLQEDRPSIPPGFIQSMQRSQEPGMVIDPRRLLVLHSNLMQTDRRGLYTAVRQHCFYAHKGCDTLGTMYLDGPIDRLE